MAEIARTDLGGLRRVIRQQFALEHLPSFDVDVRAPLAVGREGAARARLAGTDRRSREGLAETVAWLRGHALVAARP